MFILKKVNFMFIFATPLVEFDFVKYNIDDLMERFNIKCTFIDASPFLQPLAKKMVHTNKKLYEKYNIITCSSIKELEKIINKNNTALYFPMFNFYYEVREVFHLFTKYNVKYGHINEIGATIVSKSINTNKNYFSYLLKPKKIIAYLKHKKNLLSEKIFLDKTKFKKADFIALGGIFNENICKSRVLFGEDTQTIFIHSFDFEQYLDALENGANRLFENDYCVFIDQYIPYHPDARRNGTIINEKEYFNEINKFFEMINKKCGVDIVVASHPRANYDDKNFKYKNCKIIKNLTPLLIRDSKFVIAHFSTAISYAVLFNKPIINLITDTFLSDSSSYSYFTKEFSSELGSKLINVTDLSESDFHEFNIPEIHKKLYNDFIRNYIKAEYFPEKNQVHFWDAFFNKYSKNRS